MTTGRINQVTVIENGREQKKRKVERRIALLSSLLRIFKPPSSKQSKKFLELHGVRCNCIAKAKSLVFFL